MGMALKSALQVVRDHGDALREAVTASDSYEGFRAALSGLPREDVLVLDKAVVATDGDFGRMLAEDSSCDPDVSRLLSEFRAVARDHIGRRVAASVAADLFRFEERIGEISASAVYALGIERPVVRLSFLKAKTRELAFTSDQDLADTAELARMILGLVIQTLERMRRAGLRLNGRIVGEDFAGVIGRIEESTAAIRAMLQAQTGSSSERRSSAAQHGKRRK